MPQSSTILFVASVPHDLKPLDIQKERDQLLLALTTSKSPDKFKVVEAKSIQPSELGRTLRLTERLTVMHFAGHGDRNGDFAFQDKNGKTKRVFEKISNVRWLVSSRSEVDLIARLSKPSNSKLPQVPSNVMMELNLGGHKDRVRNYVETRMRQLLNTPQVRKTHTHQDELKISLELSQRAENNLPCVSLVFSELGGMDGNNAIKNIREYPAGLSKLYEYKMNRVLKLNR